MATRKSFEVIVVFEGFGNGAISFAYANRTLAGNQPRTHSGSSSWLHFANRPNNIASRMSEPLDIRHLRYFLAVAEAGSFSRAADRLGISQPSVSQQMRDLEAGLRVPLFQRRGRRILLTPRGLIFQEHARALLHQLDSFVMRRMSDEICRKHQVRPHVIAEINAIETLLRSLGPSQAGALMPKIALRGRENLKLRAIRLHGKNLGLDIGLLRLSDSAANTAVAAFTSLAKATIPKLVKR